MGKFSFRNSVHSYIGLGETRTDRGGVNLPLCGGNEEESGVEVPGSGCAGGSDGDGLPMVVMIYLCLRSIVYKQSASLKYSLAITMEAQRSSKASGS